MTHLVHRFDLSRQEGSVPFACFAAAFAILLARVEGQPRISLRGERRLRAGPSGPFAWHDLVIDGRTVREIVTAMQERLESADATPASARPSAEVVSALSDHAIIWSDDPEAVLARDAGSLGALGREGLTLVLSSAAADTSAWFVADAAHRSAAELARWANRYERVLSSLLADPTCDSLALPLLPPAEQESILEQATGPAMEPPSETVHAAIARQAALRPTHAAVRYHDESLTYAALEARANRLAHELRARGVSIGDRVVSCLEPELDVPVVLLAILKAGAIYVPVDPNYPVARIDVILADVAPALVVTRRSVMQRLGIAFPGAVLALDESGAAIAARPGTLPDVEPELTRDATIFHTSGTTGRPKGARATHANVAFFAQAARERYSIAPTDVMPVIARFSFSISIFELVAPLTAGASILLLDRDHVMDPQRMARTLEEVTFFHAGPSLLRGIVAAIRSGGYTPERYARVRHASSGGDMVPSQLLSEMQEFFPQAEVYVIYGCSEISCMGCTDEVPRAGPPARTYVGLPFAGTSVRVLDQAQRPVPMGAPGEVWFAGPGVIAGYVDRPDLDAEKFVELEGRRFYRTGDVGRWWDGRGLELLGRTDFQVKVRGMRVECAEVEFHVRQVPGIRDCAVVARELRGERVLAAFVVRDVASAPPAVDATELSARVRRALAAAVPDYMVPAAVVELSALPLNHNLKVDRNAMPALTADVRAGVTDGAAAQGPRTETERWLSRVWCELLGLSAVGRRHNFFELGGDSLMAMQVIVRVQRELGVALDGMTLLRESLSVIAGLCDAARNESGDDVVALAPEDEPAPAYRTEGFHFGPASSLFGLIHAPINPTGSRAVLICGPIGADDVRPGFVLTLLARRLAEAGVPAMRFDFFGTRDSLGEDYEGHPVRWAQDVHSARAALLARTGAAEVVAIGVRLGATMLMQADVTDGWTRRVVWDPVLDGNAHIERLEEMHRQGVNSLYPVRLRNRSRQVSGRREFLNFSWSEAALEAVRSARIGTVTGVAQATRGSIGWLATSEHAAQRAAFEAWSEGLSDHTLTESAVDPGWSDRRRILEIMPDSGVVNALLSLLRIPS